MSRPHCWNCKREEPAVRLHRQLWASYCVCSECIDQLEAERARKGREWVERATGGKRGRPKT